MMQCLIFLLIAGVSQLNGLPYAEKTADYYADDYNYSSDDYPNGDADDNVENHLGEHETPIHVNPKMMSKDSDELINEGDIIKLPCVVDTLDGFVLMWWKGNKQIAMGDMLMAKNKRYKLEKQKNGKHGNTLIISNAEQKDGGDYVCKVSANDRIEVKHKIQIRVAPVVKTDPPSGQLIVMEGETASLGCHISRGSPKPEIIWRRRDDRKFVDGKKEMAGSKIMFFKATRHHSGIYNCSADNGFSRPLPPTASKTIILDVHHKPSIELQQTFIHTKETDETEIVCVVHASPRATVEWLKDGQKMGDGENKWGITSNIKNKHSLMLPADLLERSKFGVYTCRATNKYGTDEKMVEVSGKAEPPNFKSEQEGDNETIYFLEWTAKSQTTPITSFKLEYRIDDGDRSHLQNRMQKSYYGYTTEPDISNSIEDSSDGRDKRDGKVWKTITIDDPIDDGSHVYRGRIQLTELSAMTNYVVRVSSENGYGLSNPSPQSYFYFGTKGAAPLTAGVSPLRNGEGYMSSILIICTISISLYSHLFQSAFSLRSL